MGEHRLVPVERRLGGAEVAEVVGGVAGVGRYPRDGQVVAVVRRDGADDVPQQQAADDADVGDPRGEPEPSRTVATRAAHSMTCRAGPARPARRSRPPRTARRAPSPAVSAGSGEGDEPGVDVDAGAQTRLRCHLQVGEQAGDLRLLLHGRGAGGAGDADEVGADAAEVRPQVQRAAAAGVDRRARATAATESRNATTTVSVLARTNSPLRLASMPPAGMVENTRPPSGAAWRSPSTGWTRRAPAGRPTPAGPSPR